MMRHEKFFPHDFSSIRRSLMFLARTFFGRPISASWWDFFCCVKTMPQVISEVYDGPLHTHVRVVDSFFSLEMASYVVELVDTAHYPVHRKLRLLRRIVTDGKSTRIHRKFAASLVWPENVWSGKRHSRHPRQNNTIFDIWRWFRNITQHAWRIKGQKLVATLLMRVNSSSFLFFHWLFVFESHEVVKGMWSINSHHCAIEMTHTTKIQSVLIAELRPEGLKPSEPLHLFSGLAQSSLSSMCWPERKFQATSADSFSHSLRKSNSVGLEKIFNLYVIEFRHLPTWTLKKSFECAVRWMWI